MPKVTTLQEYQEATSQTAIFPEETGLAYCVLGLNGEAGEVAEKLKKIIRDGNNELTDEKREDIKKELGDVMWYVAQTARMAGLELSDIAQTNIDKLFSRKERGVIGGSGDNR